jgi:hypothetical protein
MRRGHGRIVSAAFHVRASIVQDVPGGPPEGEYHKIHRDLGEAIGDFVRLIPFSEDVELRHSS